MQRRTVSTSNDEPEQKKFEMPSVKEHLFQITDLYEQGNAPFDINDPDIVFAKCEVVGGEEEGRTILTRCTVDDKAKGFWATQVLLKAISLPYKGGNFPLYPEEWIGRQFYARVEHNESKGKTYANIAEYNFDELVEQTVPVAAEAPTDKPGQETAWDDE